MKTKVLHITSRADTGGGPKHVYDLTRTIKKNYPEVEIYIASPDEAPFAEKYREIVKEWIEIPKRSISIASLLRVRRFVKKNGIRIVHSHGRGAGYYSRILKIIAGVKVIHTFHGVHATNNITGVLKTLNDRVFKFFTDTFICVSEDEKVKAIESSLGNEDKIVVILNGVDIEGIQHEYQNATRVHSDAMVIGTLARLNYQKGIDILLKSFAKYFQQYPESKIQVLIAGDGEEKASLLKMHADLNLGDRVKFVGNISAPISFLKELDLYISFARWEGLPLSVLEAMACGIPCLLSNVVGHKQVAETMDCPVFELNEGIDLSNFFSKENLHHSDLELFKRLYSSDRMSEGVLEVYTKNI